MKDAGTWFEEGMRHVGMARYADYHAEALRLKPGWLAAALRLEALQRDMAAATAVPDR